MSSIKKVLCVKAKNEGTKLFTTGCVYDADINGGTAWVNDNLGRKTFIILCATCMYGEWQPLEEYVCMTHTLLPELKPGETLYGYAKNGVLNFHHEGMIASNILGLFKKLSDIPQVAQYFPRHEVRHVIYDTTDDKVANDAMGECYITLSEAQEMCDEMNAPKVMKPVCTKEVEYFGVKLMVPENTKYLATSLYGTVLASEVAMKTGLCTWGSDSAIYTVCVVDLNGIDWRDTLVEIK